jgi:hypothetical protein
MAFPSLGSITASDDLVSSLISDKRLDSIGVTLLSERAAASLSAVTAFSNFCVDG